MGVITDKEMQAKSTGAERWLTEDAPHGAGRFTARISRNGERGFYFRYTTSSGSRVTLPLGSYHPKGLGGLTLAQGRERANELSKLYQSGVKDLRQHLAQVEADQQGAAASERQRLVDEQRQRDLEEQTSRLAEARRLTVRRLFDQWQVTDLQPRVRADGKRTGRVDGGRYVLEQFTRHVFPVIGDMAVEDVRRADYMALLDSRKAAGNGSTANHLLADLKQMLTFAADRELIPGNPLSTVKKSKVGGADVARDRALSDDEIHQLVPAIELARMHPRNAIAIWLTLATGVRVGELMGAVWADDMPTDAKSRTKRLGALQVLAIAEGVKLGIVDIQARTWHLPTTKNQRDHTIHLSDFALVQFEKLAQLREVLIGSTDGTLTPWVFPATKNGRPVCVKSFGKQLSDRQREPEERMRNRTKATTSLMLSGGKWTAHDLRRTAATVMARLGFPSDTINECLNHVQADKMARVYIQDRREADQVRAFDALGKRLIELTANVTQIGS